MMLQGSPELCTVSYMGQRPDLTWLNGLWDMMILFSTPVVFSYDTDGGFHSAAAEGSRAQFLVQRGFPAAHLLA